MAGEISEISNQSLNFLKMGEIMSFRILALSPSHLRGLHNVDQTSHADVHYSISVQPWIRNIGPCGIFNRLRTSIQETPIAIQTTIMSKFGVSEHTVDEVMWSFINLNVS